MSNILILGAYGQIARIVRGRMLTESDALLSEYLRRSERLKPIDPSRESIIEGDVNDYGNLLSAMRGQDIVYANLGGEFEPMAKNVVRAMDAVGVKRLIWVTGLGLYHEVPGRFGQWVEDSIGSEVMDDTRRAAQVIEESDVDSTIIRAAYMDDEPDLDYELTRKGEPFKGTTVSRAAIADLIVDILKNPSEYSGESLGIARPGTEGDHLIWKSQG
ncbi:NAD-dependent epimerase/dehydratase [Bifidobacterium actinocoloniiforme DSM 22766]|uniref:NAD-dependent epimerase/dehydratase n=1 Tax=Bifidobacterium actinocoloniiforme DSM 22766 TaxID=1437605 RepID=A0A086Z2K4_9BIFI|nr:NAD(P)H-binding protein [Bifidobacterium actinocoloniiforme]AKV55735.1 short-chain dehydrogenase [Bifidobacterium actinocoloniiforme DSM 22766]KFI40754.1 NAD-dependent epimerase/dehydratase [Bifidobacterium actinocoloniiforme DSM 22766]